MFPAAASSWNFSSVISAFSTSRRNKTRGAQLRREPSLGVMPAQSCRIITLVTKYAQME
jgi:hypothetical protein